LKKREQKKEQSNEEFKNSKINLTYKLIFLVCIPLILCVITVSNFIKQNSDLKIEILCNAGEFNSVIYNYYEYDEYSDKIKLNGVGGPTETYLADCCIDTGNGACEYEIPFEFTCEAHFYEEIRFIFTANRSCHVKYSLELYSNKKCLFKTQEKGTHIKVSSLRQNSFAE